MKKLIVYGAGGHAKSVLDSLQQDEYELYAFIDNYKTGVFLNRNIYDESFLNLEEAHNYYYFVAIGDNFVRKKVFEELNKKRFKIINIVDRTAIISKSSKIGIGCYFGKYTIVNADSIIGDNVIINNRALVEHECVVKSNTHISTNSVLNGGVKVEEGAFVGSCSVVNELRTIGNWSVVGSGSVVIKDVEPLCLYAGVPATKKKEYKEKK